jgi:putative hemolysin
MQNSLIAKEAVNPSIFSVKLPFKKGKRGFFKKALESGIEKSLALNQLNAIYESGRTDNPIHFIDNILAYLNIKVELREQDLERIPKQGSVMVMANHPFGGIEGLLMAKIIKKVRPDVKILANDILHRIPELRELFFFVNPFGTKESIKKNLTGLRQVKSWLDDSGVLGSFPAGEVASFNAKTRKIQEPAWNSNLAKMASSAKATIVPMYFSGNNSLSFHLAGLIHPRLRTALLAHQFVNKKNHTLKVSIGNPIRYKEYQHLETAALQIAYFESRTFMLRRKHKTSLVKTEPYQYKTPLIAPIKPDLMQQEINRLGANNHLLSSGNFEVYISLDAQVPNVMREIGRLREFSFRLVGEGTGKESDTDSYDHYYQHLFVWDTDAKKVVGAYRLAMIDNVMNVFGKKGLYISSLFKIQPEFLDKVFPGIELGRSFVHPDYQKSFQPLLLLWKGICAFVNRNPDYRYLLGAVSMSKDYSDVSKQLIMSYLKTHHWNSRLAPLVAARNPYKARKESIVERINGLMPFLSLEQINAMVKELDPDMGGLPILIKQYIKMNGKLAGFNVDADFSDVVDGMIIVDMLKSDPESLSRYMGEEEYRSYIEHHEVNFSIVDVEGLLTE